MSLRGREDAQGKLHLSSLHQKQVPHNPIYFTQRGERITGGFNVPAAPYRHEW